MADAVAVVRAQLAAVGAITALVGDRIGPDPLAQGEALPALVLSVVSTIPTSHLGGDGLLDQVRLQVTIKASSSDGAQALSDLVRAALFTEDQVLQNEFMDYFDETKEHLVFQDYLLWIHPSA